MWVIQQAVHGIAPPFIGISCENIRKIMVPSLSHTPSSLGKKNILRENVSHRRSIVEGGDNLFIKFSIKDVEYI